MKKIVFILGILLANLCTGQTLEIINNSCEDITFHVFATDASTSCPPQYAKSIHVNVLRGNSLGPQDILDFDALGAGPIYWSEGGSIGSSPAWGLYQGVGGPVGSPSYTCFFNPTTNSGSSGCGTVYLSWAEDLAGNVVVTAN